MLIRLAFFWFLTGILLGCTQQPAAVSSLEVPAHKKIDTHQVLTGDTLYSIAWRYDLNVRRLAAANGMTQSATIYPAQILTLDMRLSESSKATLKSPSRTVLPRKDMSSTPVSTRIESRSSTPKKSVSALLKSEPKRPKLPLTAPATVLSNQRGAQKVVKSASVGGWQWPVRGRVIERFNLPKLRKGIKIKSVSGAAVRSSAPGEIVYAGNGLRDYGKLVIIKHSDILLSAYAHNDQLLVSEGQRVEGMQIISKLGSSGTLHFEIRKDGSPVDPHVYLTK